MGSEQLSIVLAEGLTDGELAFLRQVFICKVILTDVPTGKLAELPQETLNQLLFTLLITSDLTTATEVTTPFPVILYEDFQSDSHVKDGVTVLRRSANSQELVDLIDQLFPGSIRKKYHPRSAA